jgi:hypothetical protein
MGGFTDLARGRGRLDDGVQTPQVEYPLPFLSACNRQGHLLGDHGAFGRRLEHGARTPTRRQHCGSRFSDTASVG